MKEQQKFYKHWGFTLHFATINTRINLQQGTLLVEFTLHFATINTIQLNMMTKTFWNLHYTLLLLILIEGFIKKDNYSVFTLHFATINTSTKEKRA